MSQPTAQFETSSSSNNASHEARLLAQLLRSARVVLLLGELQADRTGLILGGLAPLLAQRSTDRIDSYVRTTANTVDYKPNRRQTLDQHRECVVVFDRWTSGVGGPLQHLRHSVAAALGVGTADLEAAPKRLDEALATWTKTRDVHVLLLLHRFEDHLLAPRPGPEHAHVTDELVRLLNRPGLPVSVLLSLSEAAQPQLAGMRSLVPGLEDMSLRLKSGAASAPGRDAFTLPLPAAPVRPTTDVVADAINQTTARPNAPERSEAKRGPVDRPAIRSDDVYALINSTLTRVATGSAANPLMDGRPESSEPDIEAFQPGTVPSVSAKTEAGNTIAAEPQKDSAPAATTAATLTAPPRVGWWQRLMRLLGRRA